MAILSKRYTIGKFSFAFWQIASAVLTLVLLIAAYGFRHNIFKALINPNLPFQVDEQGKAPDYNDASAWAKRPQNLNDKNLAVFYIHPTTYYDGKEGWNATIDNPKARSILTNIVIPNHVMPFAKDAEIFMPFYRQAALLATLAFNEDTKDALDFAYTDVETAFTYFLAAIGDNKPFAIVGMNQGALHAQRLIQNFIVKNGLEKRMISAYLIDSAIPADEFLPQNYSNIKICNSPNDFNCIMSFMTLDRKDKRDQYLFRKRAPVFSIANNYAPLSKRKSICTNPLNGGSAPLASSELNKGAVSANDLEDGTSPPYLPHETGAECKNGMLLVDDGRAPALKPHTFELGTLYKVPSFNLFYEAMENELGPRYKAYSQSLNKSQ